MVPLGNPRRTLTMAAANGRAREPRSVWSSSIRYDRQAEGVVYLKLMPFAMFLVEKPKPLDRKPYTGPICNLTLATDPKFEIPVPFVPNVKIPDPLVNVLKWLYANCAPDKLAELKAYIDVNRDRLLEVATGIFSAGDEKRENDDEAAEHARLDRERERNAADAGRITKALALLTGCSPEWHRDPERDASFNTMSAVLNKEITRLGGTDSDFDDELPIPPRPAKRAYAGVSHP